MPNIIQLQIIAALAIITLLGLAVWAYRTAQKASAKGYDLGYDDAKRGHELHLYALQEEIGHLSRTVVNQRTAFLLERDAVIQDADQRISLFARRAAACTSADLNTLTAAANQLGVAQATYQRMQAEDPARFAHQMQLQLINLAERMRTALEQPNEPAQLEADAGTNAMGSPRVEEAA